MNSLNHILDASTPFNLFKSYVESYSSFIGIIKFGWGSSLVDPEFSLKKNLLDNLDIPCLPGGTLFEYFYLRDDVNAYIKFLRQNNFEWVELSRGTISIPDSEYHNLVNMFSQEFIATSLSLFFAKTIRVRKERTPHCIIVLYSSKCVRPDFKIGSQ